ncbi:ShlB/FhaC/HecB family hemolysin secretion/activation protein [Roseateles sp. L2-2]|uniref:ShlB/FhaC/HecB family hemolysin secretion/activation protein n=1 Tax=Roseateles sp. L2-2 TaxID=3422597 RepID=UPI003D36E73B
MRPFRSAVFGGTALALAAGAALAQQSPPPPLAPQVTPRDLRPPEPAASAAPLPVPAPNAVPAQARDLQVSVDDVRFSDGFPELAAASAALAAPLRGQRQTVAAFYQLADAVEALYREAGYPLVRVVVPPQQVKDGGVFELRVVDGYLERIDASAVPERARRAVEQALAGLLGRRHLRGEALERALTLAGRGPGLQMRSALGAGKEVGGTVLVLEGEHAGSAITVSADRRLSESLGPWQTTVQLRLNQALGRGEQFYTYVSGGKDWGTALRDDAPRRVLGGGAILPLTADGLSLNPEFTVSDTQPRAPAGALRSRSQLERYSLRLIYPLLLTRAQELTLTGTFDASRQIDSLPDFDFVMSEDKLRVGRIAADYVRNGESTRLRMGATLSRGLPGLGARTAADIAATGMPVSRYGARPFFTKLELNASADVELPWGLGARTSAKLQSALGHVLPSAELFTLDGEDALSTFRSGSISDDNGWTLRQELSRAWTPSIGGAGLQLQPYVFAAMGRPWSEFAGTQGHRLAASGGAGLRTRWRGAELSIEAGRRRYRPFGLDEFQAFVKAQVQF